jgi:hypothetical protein
MNYQVTHLTTLIKCLKYSYLLTKSPLIKISTNIFFVLQYTNLIKFFNQFLCTKMIMNFNMLCANMKDWVF